MWDRRIQCLQTDLRARHLASRVAEARCDEAAAQLRARRAEEFEARDKLCRAYDQYRRAFGDAAIDQLIAGADH